MTILKILPSTLQGKIWIPPSKSHTMRAILLASLAKGKSRINHYLDSPDTQAMVSAMRAFGTQIRVEKDFIEIEGMDGKLKPSENVIDAGNSGQVLRFCGALAGLINSYTILTGDHSIRHNRPVTPLLSALTQLNAFAVSSRLDDKAPIIVKGPMRAAVATLSGEDSQPVSALLIACSFLEGTTHLKVINPGEKPWIEMTLFWLKKLGGKVLHDNYENYLIEGPLSYAGFEIAIPGDFSSAAFPIAAALVTGSSLTLENVDMGDIQGDKKIIDILTKMGARFEIDPKAKSLKVLKNAELKGIQIDANDIIDAIPVLATLGCFASGQTEILNAEIARKKESDRLSAITQELKKMGADIEEKKDGLIVRQSHLKGANLFSHHDHRIAMALSIASLAANGESQVRESECITKSYPSFISDFQKVHARIL